MIKLKLKNGVRFVAEVREDDKGSEVILQYFADSDGKVIGGSVRCICVCGSGPGKTIQSKTCSKEAGKNATCDCTGGSARIIC